MKKRVIAAGIILTVLLIAVFFLAVRWGSYSMTISEVIQTFLGKGSKLQNATIFGVRLPRISVAIIVGICLSTSGCILQSVTRNELAEPGMIGINAGAALAIVLLISYGQTSYYSSIGDSALFLMPVVAITGAVLSGGIVYFLSNKKGISPNRLILIGVAMNIGLNAIISLYQLNMARGDYNQVLTWTSGSLWGSSFRLFFLVAPLSGLLLTFVIWKMKKLDILNLGDEIAAGLGVEGEKERKILFFCAVALAALATALAGNITFLGLLGPQIAKKIVGPTHRRQIPFGALISCIIILFADSVSRNVFSPIEIPVGITIAIVGVPYFIYLMMNES